MDTGNEFEMSKQPLAKSSQWDRSYEIDENEIEEANGSNDYRPREDDSNSDEDKLTEAGDIGVGQNVYASYQKSGHKSKGKKKSNMEVTPDGFEEDDFVNINSSLKTRKSHSWFRHPKVRENWKTVAGAIFLLSIGIMFLICGIVLSAIPKHDGPKSLIFFVCAAVCILPGGYHTVYIYRATKGWRGYTFESLPNFQ